MRSNDNGELSVTRGRKEKRGARVRRADTTFIVIGSASFLRRSSAADHPRPQARSRQTRIPTSQCIRPYRRAPRFSRHDCLAPASISSRTIAISQGSGEGNCSAAKIEMVDDGNEGVWSRVDLKFYLDSLLQSLKLKVRF